ncbi:MAG: flagellar motor protein MotD [Nitrosomonadales bacterium]|nr:flagellar motor protein MotD [Nitrosomonadales bacterium]
MRLRRQRRREHENHDRWVISYADFVTLLFAFFVVMYGISSVSESKFKMFSASLSSAFSSHGAQPTIVPMTQEEMFLKSIVDRRNARLAELQLKRSAFIQKVTSDLNRVLAALIRTGLVKLSQNARGVEIEINASALFETGRAEIQPASAGILVEVARVLAPDDHPLEVDGYTDDIPISTTQFPSNWELSSARASSVARMFIEHGVSSSRLTVVGLADNRPVDSNATPEGRAHNRRITITIVAPQADRVLDGAPAVN